VEYNASTLILSEPKMTFKKVDKLLAVSADAKTIKGEYLGILTGILYLAPVDLSGFQVCPKASAGCKAACLYTAGRGYYQKTRNARVNKTRWFFLERESFMATLVNDIKSLIRKANRKNMMPAVRLNGTSDIAWEKFAVVKGGVTYRNIMEAYPNVIFYDYTKVIGRNAAIRQHNYHLTFSLAENNEHDAKIALETGYNVAVVTNIKRKAEKPKTWAGYPVIDGDASDVRFLDAKGGHIVMLTAKGQARKDKSGFVKDITNENLFHNVLTKVA
jgi:hypothetical protein